jgi:methyl-accepting chemotaxis protein
LINQSGDRVESGVKLVNKTGESLMGIITSVSEVSRIMADIASAGREQATGLQEVNGAVAQMDTMTQQNASMVEENTAAARTMLDETNRLVELMSFFKNVKTDGPSPIISPAPRPAAQSPVRLVASVPSSSRASDERWDEF